MNLAFSDFAASTFHFLSAYSNFNGRWAFGSFGCQLYGMAIGFFGLVSILTFSAIACERCLVIACPIVSQVAGLADGRWKITRAQAKKVRSIKLYDKGIGFFTCVEQLLCTHRSVNILHHVVMENYKSIWKTRIGRTIMLRAHKLVFQSIRRLGRNLDSSKAEQCTH